MPIKKSDYPTREYVITRTEPRSETGDVSNSPIVTSSEQATPAQTTEQERKDYGPGAIRAIESKGMTPEELAESAEVSARQHEAIVRMLQSRTVDADRQATFETSGNTVTISNISRLQPDAQIIVTPDSVKVVGVAIPSEYKSGTLAYDAYVAMLRAYQAGDIENLNWDKWLETAQGEVFGYEGTYADLFKKYNPDTYSGASLPGIAIEIKPPEIPSVDLENIDTSDLSSLTAEYGLTDAGLSNIYSNPVTLSFDEIPNKGDSFKGGTVSYIDTETGFVHVYFEGDGDKVAPHMEYYIAYGDGWRRVDGNGVDWEVSKELRQLAGGVEISTPEEYEKLKEVIKIITESESFADALDKGVSLEDMKKLGINEQMIKLSRYANLIEAIKAGMTDDELIKAGVSLIDIRKAKDGEIAFINAKKALGDIVGYEVTDKNYEAALKEYNEIMDAIDKLKPYTDESGGIDVFKAAENVDASILRTALGMSFAEIATYQNLAKYAGDDNTFDIVQAIKDGYTESEIRKVMGITDAEWAEFKKAADFEEAGFFEKLKMSYEEDPGEFFKAIGISLIPIYGTAKYWKDMNTGMKIASVLTDVAILIPFVNLASASVKAGVSLPRALLKTSYVTARGVIVSPYTILRHPIETFKSMFSWTKNFKKSEAPLAAYWRGSYAPDMDIPKLIAAPDPKLTRQAMETLQRQIAGGKATGKVIIPETGEVVKYSGTGLQDVLPDTFLHTTPAGPSFKGVGVDVTGEGIFTSLAGNYGLTIASATGRSPGLVFKGDELIGVLGKAGEVLNDKGKAIGNIKIGTKVTALDGSKLGEVASGGVVMAKGKPIARILEGGTIMTDDLSLIGKYYKDTPVWDGQKLIGTINKDGYIVDKAGKIVSASRPKVIGYIDDGAKIEGVGGIIIGKTKSQPVFAIIKTKGLKALPDYMKNVDSMTEMEKRAWQMFNKGEGAGDVYPVFKQYAKWIEEEQLIPKGSKLIPVLDDVGRPVYMSTTGIQGETIKIPMLQMVTKDYFEQALKLTKVIRGELEAGKIALEPRTVEEALVAIKTLPKKALPDLLKYLRGNKNTRIYGSAAEYINTGGRKPGDLDLAAKNVTRVADDLAKILKRYTKKQVRVTGSAEHSSIEILDAGLWRKVIDISTTKWISKPLGYGLAPESYWIVDGVKVQTPQSQLQRLLVRTSEQFGTAAPLRYKALAKKLGYDIELGIGAKPPTIGDLTRLKIKGIKNTIRDIFIKGLNKSGAVKQLKKIAPDLSDEIEALIKQQRRLAKIEARARARTLSSRASSRLALARQALDERITRLRRELERRADLIDRLIRPARGRVSREEYNKLVKTYQRQIRQPRGRRIARVVRVERGLVGRREYAPREARTTRPPRVPRVPRIPKPPKPPRRPRPPRMPRIPKTPKLFKPRGGEVKGESLKQAKGGQIAWRQGSIRQGKELKDVWYIISYPYKKKSDVEIKIGGQPKGARMVKGAGSAYRTIQTLEGMAPKDLFVDLGIFDVIIKTPIKKAGRKGSIKYKPDVKQKTKGDIILKGVK